jgi:hypothetical protein
MSFAIQGGNAACYVFSLDPSAPKYPHCKVASRKTASHDTLELVSVVGRPVREVYDDEKAQRDRFPRRVVDLLKSSPPVLLFLCWSIGQGLFGLSPAGGTYLEVF